MSVGLGEKLRLRVSRRDLDFEAEGEKATVLELYERIVLRGDHGPQAKPSVQSTVSPAETPPATHAGARPVTGGAPFVNSAAPAGPPAPPPGSGLVGPRALWLGQVYPDGRWRVAAIAAAAGVSMGLVYKRAGELKLARASRRGRKCLHCQTLFPSEGPHQRLCPACRNRSGGIEA